MTFLALAAALLLEQARALSSTHPVYIQFHRLLLLIERSLDKVLESQVSLRFPVEGVEAHISFPLPREA